MKISASAAVVSRDDVTTDVSFKIKASGKAFKILSDSLYTDKPRAILRELSCNAYDAHVAAKRPQEPFLVKLPTSLDPSLVIRDYGIGLSHQDVITIATTYFESTKTESNDFVGALGLGSKSPFSYVDSYTITSYFNGVKRIYCAFIDSDETPKITLMNGQYVDSSVEGSVIRSVAGITEVLIGEDWWQDGTFSGDRTDDPNGLEISMPVRERDIHIFHEKARVVFQHFTVRPTVIPALRYNDDVLTSGSNWKIVLSSGYNNTFTAVQGNVAYPIDVEALSSTDIGRDQYDFVQRIVNYRSSGTSNIVLNFNIGDLDVAASREGLSYKKTTYMSLSTALSKMSSELAAVAQKEVDACESLWDAMLLCNDKFQNSIMRLVVGKMTYGGKAIPQSFEIKEADVKLLGVVRYKQANRVSISPTPTTHGFEISTSRWYRSQFVIKDCRDAMARIRHNLKAESVYFIETADNDGVKQILNDLMPGYPIIMASELEAAPKVVRANTGTKNTTTGNVRTLRIESNKAVIDPSRVDVTMEDGGVYIEMEKGTPIWDGTNQMTGSIAARIHLLMTNFLEDVQVVVPYSNDMKKFKESDKWVTLKEYVTNQLKDAAVIKKIQENGTSATATIDRTAEQLASTENFKSLASLLKKTKPDWAELCDRVNTYGRLHFMRTVAIPDMAKFFNITLPKDSPLVDEVNKAFKEIFLEYPMVKMLNSYWLNAELVNSIKSCVDAVDRAKFLEKTLNDHGIKV